MVFFAPLGAFGYCTPSGSCGNSTSGNSTVSFGRFSNSTLLLGGFSNATSGPGRAMDFDQFSNSTYLGSNHLQTIGEDLGFNDSATANNTNQTLPLRLLDLKLGQMKGKSGGDSLALQGNGFVDENTTTPAMQRLTISAWVKPDYGQGSSVFTVVADENAFVLAVNSNMPPEKVATFSVFDGIHWTTVSSVSKIPDKWTHLAGTFNGTSIGIYVNGILEGTSHVDSVPALVDGRLVTRVAQNITSDQNVTIGAYFEKERGDTRNLFSGEISNVNLYGICLSPEQVQQVYHTTRPAGYGRQG